MDPEQRDPEQAGSYAKRHCIHCGEYRRVNDDGWCSTCSGESEGMTECERIRALETTVAHLERNGKWSSAAVMRKRLDALRIKREVA